MPRRSLAGSSSSTPLRTPSVDPTASTSSPSSARLTRSTRATSTPRPTSASSSVPHGDAHHHLTADGLARIEAEKLMATPTNSRLGTPESSRKASSARDQRHLRLLQSREKLARARSEDGEDSADEDDGEEAEDDSAGLTTATLDGETIEMASSTSSRNEEQDEGAQRRKRNGLDDTAMTQDGTSQSAASETSHAEIESNDGTEKGERVIDGDLSNVSTTIPNDFGSSNVFHEDAASDNGEGSADSDEDAESSSGGSSSDESDSDSDGESDSETSASEDDEEEASDSDEEEERLEMLLQAARISALAKQQGKPDPKKSAGESEVVLQFDEEKKEAPIPDITIANLPRAHMSFSADGSAKASASELVLPKPKSSKGKDKAIAPELELDNRAYVRPLSKREKAAQPKKATPSELWATLPAARRDALQQMKRDYQALSLANTLDPKRFMKGGMKLNKVPENFAIGTIVEQPKHLQDTTLRRDVQYRPGQIVADIARDEGINATAKRKFGDLEDRRMKNGRGRGWKKRTKW